MMNKLGQMFLYLLLFAIFAQAQTLSQNVQFTDLEGNSYDLYGVLGEGKHVLCHLQYND